MSRDRNVEEALFLPYYVLILALSTVVLITAAALNRWEDLVTAAIVTLVVLFSLLNQRSGWLRIPFAFNLLLVILLLATQLQVFLPGTSELVTMISSVIVGLIIGSIGFMLVYSMLSQGDRPRSAGLVSLMSFSFGLAMGVLWEMMEYGFSVMLYGSASYGVESVMADLYGVTIGAFLISLAGILYIRSSNLVFERLVVRFIERNPEFLGWVQDDDSTGVYRLIHEGESDHLEFKATLRTNLHTGEKDKRMENASLKSLVAFMNSNGGTLLIGVSDDGDPVGMDASSFESLDRLNLHFSNLVAQHIGNEFSPFINPRMVDMGEDRSVMRVDCRASDRPVFLRIGGKEEFYIRTGPQSVTLEGRELVRYIDRRFSRTLRL